MKKTLFTLAICAATALASQARQLAPDEALDRALGSESTRTTLSTKSAPTAQYRLLSSTSTSGEATTYIFGRTAGKGYLVVSADDATPPLLGYSDEGSFDPANPSLAYWLNEYNRQIAYMRAHQAADSVPESVEWGSEQPPFDDHGEGGGNISGDNPSDTTITILEPIAPMLTTQWNQSAPFNNLCPQISGKRCVTGCVATAMAQVLNYHKYPAQGKGQKSYTWYVSSSQRDTVSYDYANATFDWDNMLNTYTSGKYTAEQADAVANLMLACGVAVEMNYGTSSSGAIASDIAEALPQYFGYSHQIRNSYREYYGLEEWDRYIYYQLRNYGPVLYTGQSGTGGHEFVVDGYSSDGYFHINWGWGGMSDGYFLLTALDPAQQGIGGSASGYNFDQCITANVKPDPDGTSTDALPFFTSPTPFSIDDTSAKLGDTIQFTTGLDHDSDITITMRVVLSLTNESSGETYYTTWAASYANISLPPNRYYNTISIKTTLPADLPAGTYEVSPVVQGASGKYYPLHFIVGTPETATIKVTADGDVTLHSKTQMFPAATNVELGAQLFVGKNLLIDATITNRIDEEYYGMIYVGLTKTKSVIPVAKMQLDLNSNAVEQIQVTGKLPTSITAGDYTMALYAEYNGYIYQISSSQPVTVEEAPSESVVTASDVTFLARSAEIPADDVALSAEITCTEGIFYNTVTIFFYYKSGSGEWKATYSGDSEMLYLTEGQSAIVTFHVNFYWADSNHQYAAFLYNGKTPISEWNYFTIADDGTTGVSDAEALSPIGPSSTVLYDLYGRVVNSDNPTPGHYIKVITSANGTITTQHELIN